MPYNRGDDSMYAYQNPYENHPGAQNQSRFYEDQVLFKSNGFDANATSSGKNNESGLPQSPTIYERNKEHDDSKLTGTANFERPREYDVKYSDYRRTNQYSASQTRSEITSYDQAKDYYNNPFKSREGDVYQPREYESRDTAPFGYQQYRSHTYNYPPVASQDNVDQYKQVPKYLHPQEESKYGSQENSPISDDDEDYESEEEEDEGEDSEYEESEPSQTHDYKSNSSLSNYNANYTEDLRGGNRANYPHENMHNYNQRHYHEENYQNMYQSIPESNERNPQFMSSIGSDNSPNMGRGGQGINPYGMYQQYKH